MFDDKRFQQHVNTLFVKPDDTIGRTVHAAVGISGEAGEVLDMIKKSWIYGKDLDRTKLVLEMGDILFYYFALMAQHGITLDEIAEANYAKLAARYPQGYTDAAAIARADLKVELDKFAPAPAPGVVE
jgi:NTP pyrophosphatase (non-canonical NTP hydrolase)